MIRIRNKAGQAGFILLPVILLLSVIAAIALMMTQKGLVDSKQAKNSIDSEQVRYTAEAILQKSVWELKQNDTCAGYAFTEAAGQFGGDDYNVEISATSGSPVTLNVGVDLGGGVTKQFSRQIKMYQVTEFLLDASGDTYIDQWEMNQKYGANNKLSQKSQFSRYRRSLLKFDLSSISASGDKILSSNLEIYLVGSPDTNTEEIAVYTVTADWDEPKVSWNKRTQTDNWSDSGGDFDPTEHTRTLVDENAPGLYTWDILDLTRDWVAANVSNYGVILRNTSFNSNAFEFASREYADVSKRPKLRITVQCECGQVCS